METLVKILIYIHAFFGGLGLISGIAGIAVKKGSKLHKNSGKAFSYSMFISSLVSLVIARMPGHENLFLFLIGVYTIYLVLAGNRALTFKGDIKSSADTIDKTISGTMLGASVLMLLIGIYQLTMHKGGNAVLFAFFGGFGLYMTLKDFYTFRVFKEKKNAWLSSHIGRMVAALIASITAFMVAGLHLQTLVMWTLPSVIGTIYISYWNRKIKGMPSLALAK
ncbi:DUF2306 domain-containing protein [Chitinophaga sancti]|uniref:DUF2306 domain-containing protein n=1 Tax=Chitinophaga sancti TaxID=1004 RepID=A0A1K1RKU0_9BACT|nr:hypothetical protein [Chitinophaga sancti]WQD60777.1 hypothetical protein U0033_23035 [Chitinophaga sancti]WQG87095.1 hypothetical protein SR876_19435 [Chitinophaga sancti]SFW72460.1 hypothetical protein SAMN05661012_03938 [Chitinophaga sancti]